MIGKQIGAYRVVAKLGEGGMGAVYRATDTRLGREIALKILPSAVAADHERLARFHREARAAAALNHPNIVTLFSAEESDGVHFLTMELVDGRPLDELIPAEGFPADRVIELATALAEAVATAHDKGLVHRDLKPANVMLTGDGRVKVLDFGLAKEIRSVSPEDSTGTSFGTTQEGVVVGTPLYMSPEQISGAAVDHRSDVFSLGIVLYEMLTGRRPFHGKSQMELAASILRDPPPEVSKPDAPSGLVDLDRTLPRQGRRGASPVGSITRDGTAGAQARIRSVPESIPRARDESFWVAVAPFTFRGTETSLTSFAEGLTAEINTGLSRFSYLRVIGTGSSEKAARLRARRQRPAGWIAPARDGPADGHDDGRPVVGRHVRARVRS